MGVTHTQNVPLHCLVERVILAIRVAIMAFSLFVAVGVILL